MNTLRYIAMGGVLVAASACTTTPHAVATNVVAKPLTKGELAAFEKASIGQQINLGDKTGTVVNRYFSAAGVECMLLTSGETSFRYCDYAESGWAAVRNVIEVNQ